MSNNIASFEIECLVCFEIECYLWKDGAGEKICYLLDEIEIPLDVMPVAIAEVFAEKPNTKVLDITMLVPVFAEAATMDPESNESYPVVDGDIKLELITVDRKDMPPNIFGSRIFNMIQKLGQDYAEENIDEIVSE